MRLWGIGRLMLITFVPPLRTNGFNLMHNALPPVDQAAKASASTA